MKLLQHLTRHRMQTIIWEAFQYNNDKILARNSVIGIQPIRTNMVTSGWRENSHEKTMCNPVRVRELLSQQMGLLLAEKMCVFSMYHMTYCRFDSSSVTFNFLNAYKVTMQILSQLVQKRFWSGWEWNHSRHGWWSSTESRLKPYDKINDESRKVDDHD